MKNIFENIPDATQGEVFETIVENGNVRIERIVSEGQATPEGQWLCQKENEWVILLAGSAEILFEDDGTRYNMAPGDQIFIKSRRRHRVERTDAEKKTLWIAVHF